MSAVTATASPESLSKQQLAERWAQILQDPVLRNLPYRIEVNKWGHIEMMPPPSPMHMRVATTLAILLREQLGGTAFTESAIATASGVRIADVVCCSDAYMTRHSAAFKSWEPSLVEAPELCIEVMSPSNLYAELREKVMLYLAAGAREAWIVSSDLTIDVYDATGRRSTSALQLDLAVLVAALRAL